MDATQSIIKTFVSLASAPQALFIRTDLQWGAFQNLYAVWPTTGTEVATYTITRPFIAPDYGTYYIRATVDNIGSLYVDGKLIIGSINSAATNSPDFIPVTLTGGSHELKFVVSNSGGAAGVACAISTTDQNPTEAQTIWNTRLYATSDTTGRYRTVMPWDATISAYLYGAGGGAGGASSITNGGQGSAGLCKIHTFNVVKGDELEVVVGAGGGGGASGGNGAGNGGASRTNLNNDPTQSFNGGNGSSAGQTNRRGSGGGGGGATLVLVNDVPVAVAGGGGGGGGGGDDKDVSSPSNSRKNAAPTNNANGRYSAGTILLNLSNGSEYIAGANGVTVGYFSNYSNVTTMSQPPNGNIVMVFGWQVTTQTQVRTLTSSGLIDLSAVNVISYYVNLGTSQSWGDIPNSDEPLLLEYSTNGSSWVTIDEVSPTIPDNTWTLRTVTLPSQAKIVGGVYLRYRQNSSGARPVSRDTWAATSILAGISNSDLRGESGQAFKGNQTRAGTGGGGGGYPGGQGGIASVKDDDSGYAGETGGNYPPDELIWTSGSWTFVGRKSTKYPASFAKYGVWPTSAATTRKGTFVEYRTFNVPADGRYTFYGAADNSMTFRVDDQVLFSVTESSSSAEATVVLFLTKGAHKLTFEIDDQDGDGTFAVTIADSKGTIIWDTVTFKDGTTIPSLSDYKYYQSPWGQGGASSSRNGQAGYAVLVITPTNFEKSFYYKDTGTWRLISDVFVKVDDNWQTVSDIFVKINGEWRPIRSYTIADIVFTSSTGNYGSVVRDHT